MRTERMTLCMALCCLCLNTIAQSVPDYVPTDGLVAWYPFNGNANDESGNGNDGVAVSVESAVDRFGASDAAFYFSGAGCTSRVDIDMNTTSITEGISISIWINRQGNGCLGPRIFEARPSVGGDQGLGEMIMSWGNNYSKPQQWSHNTTEASGTAYDVYMPADSVQDVPNSTWALFVYTNDGADARFYQNGIQISSMSNPPNSTVFLPSDIALGRMNHSAWDAFNGLLDDVGFWNRALTEEEISELYNAELPVPGCINASACNFDEEATTDDGSCIPSGCMEAEACNYNALAECVGEECAYSCCPGPGCCSAGMFWDYELEQCLLIEDASNEEGSEEGNALDIIPASAADFLKGQVVGNRVFMELDCTQLLDSVALLNAALANTTADIAPDPGSNEFTCGDLYNYQDYNYDTVQIGDQCWFAENLRSTQFTDGSAIPTSAVDPFGDNAANTVAWGLMYEGTAVIDSRGLCPSDWHISSNADWQQLINHAANNGFSGNESTALKSASGWSSGANGSDVFGFNAKPGGFHYNPTHATWGEFNHSMTSGYWWTSTIQSASESIAWTLQNDYLTPSYLNSNGMSVRCLKDTEQPN